MFTACSSSSAPSSTRVTTDQSARAGTTSSASRWAASRGRRVVGVVGGVGSGEDRGDLGQEGRPRAEALDRPRRRTTGRGVDEVDGQPLPLGHGAHLDPPLRRSRTGDVRDRLTLPLGLPDEVLEDVGRGGVAGEEVDDRASHQVRARGAGQRLRGRVDVHDPPVAVDRDVADRHALQRTGDALDDTVLGRDVQDRPDQPLGPPGPVAQDAAARFHPAGRPVGQHDPVGGGVGAGRDGDGEVGAHGAAVVGVDPVDREVHLVGELLAGQAEQGQRLLVPHDPAGGHLQVEGPDARGGDGRLQHGRARRDLAHDGELELRGRGVREVLQQGGVPGLPVAGAGVEDAQGTDDPSVPRGQGRSEVGADAPVADGRELGDAQVEVGVGDDERSRRSGGLRADGQGQRLPRGPPGVDGLGAADADDRRPVGQQGDAARGHPEQPGRHGRQAVEVGTSGRRLQLPGGRRAGRVGRQLLRCARRVVAGWAGRSRQGRTDGHDGRSGDTGVVHAAPSRSGGHRVGPPLRRAVPAGPPFCSR